MVRPGLHFPAMCIQRADAVNVGGGGKYFGRIGGGVTQRRTRAVNASLTAG
jgi:hypothetical protein